MEHLAHDEEPSPPSCSTCGERYRFRGPPPFLLPYLQSVCQSCLESHVSNNPHCSLCLGLVHTDNNFPRCCYDCIIDLDVAYLCYDCKKSDAINVPYHACPKDAVTEQEVLKLELEHSPSQFLCTNKDDGNQANVYCLDCLDFLCEICQTAHADIKMTKGHETIPIKDYAKDPKTQIFCDMHESQALELYDESCETFMCYECCWVGHGDCDTQTTHIKLKDVKTEIGAEMKVLVQKLEINQDIEQTLTAVICDLDRQEQELYDLVKVTFDDLKAVVSQREAEVMVQLRNCLEQIRKTNTENKEVLKTHQMKTTSALRFAKKIPNLTSCQDLLAMENIIRTLNRDCISQKLPKINKDASLIFARDGLPVLKDAIANFGYFYTSLAGDVLPEKEYVYLPRGQVENLKTECDTLEASLQQCEDSLRALSKIETTCLTLDAERANSKYVHIQSQCQTLKNSPPPTNGKRDILNTSKQKRLENYQGTVSTRSISKVNPEYWEINVDVTVKKSLVESHLVFDFGLSSVDSIDIAHTNKYYAETAPLCVFHCKTHKGVCLQSKTMSGKNKCLKRVFDNTEGPRVNLKYGVLTSPDRGVYTVIDLISEDVLMVLTYNTSEEIWPVFGAYNQRWVTVEMQLISTDKLLFAAKSALIIKATETTLQY